MHPADEDRDRRRRRVGFPLRRLPGSANGHDVSLIAFGERARALATHCVSVQGAETFSARCDIVTEPKRLHSANPLFATKIYDTPLHCNRCPRSRSQGLLRAKRSAGSFFNSLKNEGVHGVRYETRDEARAEIFDYIEVFYNRIRRHSALCGISPARYYEAWLAKQGAARRAA